MKRGEVRQPAVAGSFYPNDPITLKKNIQSLLDQVPKNDNPPPIAMVAPHAGYIYSGYTAATAYKTLKPHTKKHPLRVFVLSPSHRVYLDGVSVGNYQAYKTPLGEVELDQEIIQHLASLPDVTQDPSSHSMEHALEVHLPFLQETVGHFKLVPILFGDISGGHLADILSSCWQVGDLIIASSDLSHFHPYEKAIALDNQCHEAVLNRTPKAMTHCEACGNTGITALLELARRHKWQPILADYRNSGDTAGDKERVVGYASYLFYDAKTYHPKQSNPTHKESSKSHSSKLTQWVRSHLDNLLSGKKGLDSNTLTDDNPDLKKIGACFITLNKNNQLRGCIGSLEAHRPLANDLLENAVSAALHDPRFQAVTHKELKDLSIEISLLSPPEPFPYTDADDLLKRLKPNIHGVILSKNGRRSTFLPQVWKQIPDPKVFLEHLCQKAGLTTQCWQDKPTIFVYTVEKIVEP